MSVGLLMAFVAVSAVVIVAPGPDTAVTMRAAFVGGRSSGVWCAFGVACGQLIWSLATSLGLVALLTASEPLFLGLKYAGALYLLYLGFQALRSAWRPGGSGTEAPTVTRMAPSRWTSLSRGLVSDLANPKMAVFFASLLPQFAGPGNATFGTLMTLGAVFATLTFLWLAGYAALTACVGDVLRRPSVRRAIEAVTGTVLVGLGVRIAVE